MNAFTAVLPIRTVSESNSSEHWATRGKRHTAQQFVVKCAMMHVEITLPCSITITRLAPRKLDDDNLRGSLKWIRDEISDVIMKERRVFNRNGTVVKLKGRNDSNPKIQWIYEQQSSKEYAVKIMIA